MDLSNSTTLPQPDGQDHDRTDSQMENTEFTSNGHIVELSPTDNSVTGASTRQQDEGPEVMDTTPDSQEEPSTNGVGTIEEVTPAPIPVVGTDAPESDHVPLQVSNNESTEDPVVPVVEESRPQTDGGLVRAQSPPSEPTSPGEADMPPPPPPAPPIDIETPQANSSNTQRDYDDSDTTTSDEEDEPRQIRWEEDRSTPDEEELKEIEENGPEISALDSQYSTHTTRDSWDLG